MKEFYIDTIEGKVHAKLNEPSCGEKRMPLVIMVHGLTGSMEEQQLVTVCEMANRLGMASLLVEMYGHGMSEGDFAKHKVSIWVSQVVQIVNRIFEEGKYSDIYLAGHSQGGLTVMLAAALLKEKLKGLILMAPATCIVIDSRNGIFFGSSFDKNKVPKTVTFWEEFTLLGDYLEDAMQLKYEDAISEYKNPVLIVHGTQDESVPFGLSEVLEKQYENAYLVPIENDLHCFDRHVDIMGEAVYEYLKAMDQCVSVETMRKSDAWTIANLTSSKELMFRAGKGIYDSAKWKGPVGIICGKGNNAGDGFVVADLLNKNGIECELILLSDEYSEDGKYYMDIAVNDSVKCRKYTDEMDFDSYGSLLDCIFGTGFRGSVKEDIKSVIEKVNASNAYVVSADINSGLNGNTGKGDCFVKSDLTVSIGSYKFGHFLGNAKEAMKNKVNVDIGIKII